MCWILLPAEADEEGRIAWMKRYLGEGCLQETRNRGFVVLSSRLAPVVAGGTEGE